MVPALYFRSQSKLRTLVSTQKRVINFITRLSNYTELELGPVGRNQSPQFFGESMFAKKKTTTRKDDRKDS